ncbi:anti-sigma F factor [Serpentinicella alkaliphila]|uniref:Anti-sigma F factor n=1 Tax=Serpentinicella alkaliphila TaxID=1734049 RepID=A0A4R2TFH1_9FIRM|nr:anti-sigma F factor [Serpentinicella alkaliphila]QUH26011.1 anti-sigma F factor [Serpentinicella alkaliphila]TCQ02128.1 stage II sporulation protein AB (anti-sigma F factor) [Serpentinicella alkaliphila]
MAYKNHMKLQFDSKSQNEAFARVVAAAFAAQLDPTIEEIADIKTAVSEAVTNAIIHGYEDHMGSVLLECSINDDILEIIIEDNGKGIEDIQQAREPLFTSKPELERSGMGFTVMETFMDEVEVISEIGKGTRVRMIKKFNSLKEE